MAFKLDHLEKFMRFMLPKSNSRLPKSNFYFIKFIFLGLDLVDVIHLNLQLAQVRFDLAWLYNLDSRFVMLILHFVSFTCANLKCISIGISAW